MWDTSIQAYPSMPQARRDIVFRQVGDEWLLFDPVSGEIHVLNLPAAILWSHCDGTTPVASVLEALREAYGDAPPETELVDEARSTLGEFRNRQLVVSGSEGSESGQGSPAR